MTANDVLITPASKKIEFFDNANNIDGAITLNASDQLVISATNDLILGDTAEDIHIGDGSGTIDLVFDQSGRIYGASTMDITIGKSSVGSNDIIIDSPNWSVTQPGVLDVTNITISGAQGSDGQVLTSTGSGVGWEASAGGGGGFDTAGTGLTSSSTTVNVIGGTGITANANDVAVTALQTGITSVKNTSLVIGRDDDNTINFGTDNEIRFRSGGANGVKMTENNINPFTDNDISLGTALLKYKEVFTGLMDAENIKVNGGQGDDGQVLTSTGSGVGWEDSAGSGDFNSWVKYSFRRDSIGTDIINLKMLASVEDTSGGTWLAMPTDGTVKACTVKLWGVTLSASTTTQTFAVQLNNPQGSGSNSSQQSFTVSSNQFIVNNTHGSHYSYTKTGLSFSLLGGDSLGFRRTVANSIDIGNIEVDIWVEFD